MARSNQRGAAIITTLLASALLALIASMATEQATVSFLIEQRVRESAEALIAAESGLSAALADFAAEPRFDRFDLAAGTAFPFTNPVSIAPLPPSFHVDTKVRPRSGNRVDFVATARGRRHARRTLAATIERGADPYVPAALFLDAPAPSVTMSGRLAISGSSRAGNPIPALATRSRGQAEDLLHHLAAAGASLAGTPLAQAASWSELAEVVQRVRRDADLLPEVVSGQIAPTLVASAASVEITTAQGAGLWLIDGNLTVRADFTFEGLLLVLGDIHFQEESQVKILGALVQASPGRTLNTRGDTTISYRSAALRAVDSSHPGILERRARLIGWRDES